MLLKEVYNHEFLQNLSNTILKFDKKFDEKEFLKIAKGKTWEDKSLKERMRAITIAINSSLSVKNFQQKVEILKKTVIELPKDKSSGLALIIFPDFIEVFGLKDFEYSMLALEFFTEFGSSEFAVRQFIKLNSANIRPNKVAFTWTFKTRACKCNSRGAL